MRWGNGELRFSRPIRWLVALCDQEILPLEIVNGDSTITSDRLSRGHRILHQSRNLDVNQAPSPQQPPTGENQRTSQQHRNQAQSNGEKHPSLTPEQQLEDNNNQEAVTTLQSFFRLLNLQPDNGFRVYEGKRYLVRISTDEQTIELHAKDGRGLILEKKDGKVTANLSDEDRKMIHDVNSQISQRIAQLERDRQQREKQRRRGRGRSR